MTSKEIKNVKFYKKKPSIETIIKIHKTHESLNNEQKELIKEDKIIMDEIKEEKNRYRKHLNDFTEYTKTIIEKENERDKISHKISSLLKKQKMILTSITDEFFSYVHPMTLHMKQEIIVGVLLILNFTNGDHSQLEIFLLSKESLLTLLNLSSEYYHTLSTINAKEFNDKRDAIQNIKNSFSNEFIFPIDTIYEYGLNCFDIIQSENEVNKIQEQIEKIVEEKNQSFLLLKGVENNIFSKEACVKKINEYLQYINTVMEKLKMLKMEKDEEKKKRELNEILSIIEKNKNLYKELIKKIGNEKSKKNLKDHENYSQVDNKKKIKLIKRISTLNIITKHLSKNSSKGFENSEKGNVKNEKDNNKMRKTSWVKKRLSVYKNNLVSDRKKTKSISYNNNNKNNSVNRRTWSSLMGMNSYKMEEQNDKMNSQKEKDKKDNSTSKDSTPFKDIDSVCDELNVQPMNIIGGKIKKEYNGINYSNNNIIPIKQIGKNEQNYIKVFKIEKPINMGGCCVSCT